jgi:DNA-directed RNA polymerase subunit RPC12/RpoP
VFKLLGIMDEGEDKIIVFDAYDTVVAANLVKTKLDAFGVPCFLTDEYITSLYPIRNDIFPGIRLHIFERDFQRAKEILSDVTVLVRHCPECRSKEIELAPKRRTLINWLALISLGILFPVREVYRCQECKREFDYIPED